MRDTYVKFSSRRDVRRRFWHNFKMLQFQTEILFCRIVNKLRQLGPLLDKTPNQNVKCSLKRNWTKLILGLEHTPRKSLPPCTGTTVPK
jgi:hypothetical protein